MEKYNGDRCIEAGSHLKAADLPDPRELFRRLRQERFRPSKTRGQNFLLDTNLIAALVDEVGLTGVERIVEIGPGCGSLTIELLKRGHSVFSVEIDERLANLLKSAIPESAQWALFHGDALASKNQLNPGFIEELSAWAGPAPIAYVSNLPYAIATPVTQLLLDLETPRVDQFGLLVQAELADRWLSPVDRKSYAPISIFLQLLGEVQRGRSVSPQCFLPPPQVDSTFVTWRRTARRSQSDTARDALGLARELFLNRRKMVRGRLEDPVLEAAGIEGTRRPAQISPAEYAKLSQLLSKRS